MMPEKQIEVKPPFYTENFKIVGRGPAVCIMATPICYQSSKIKKGSTDRISHEVITRIVHLP